jgi:hypothetical protein
MQKASSDDALRKQEALTYLRELKERLKNKKDTYDEFLEIMKEFKAQRCASGPNVLFFLFDREQPPRGGCQSAATGVSPCARRREPRPSPSSRSPAALSACLPLTSAPALPDETGSTPRVSSSESRRFSGDTKTSSSVSTSSCRRCVRQISRVSRRRAMRTARHGDLDRWRGAYPRRVGVFASFREAAVAPARAIPPASRLFSSRPSITRQQRTRPRVVAEAASVRVRAARVSVAFFFESQLDRAREKNPD